ncbi:MAG: flagellar hook capping FlgD N-terminal domain-containing protein [Spirochaetota bacterium]
MPSPTIDPSSTSIKNRYLKSNKNVNIQQHLERLKKQEQSGLQGVEVREKAKQLGKNDFLKLLITQLSHQDPTNPLKDQDFIAQMAQFSSLEQMQHISKGISRMEMKQSYSLVGKFVSGPDMINGENVAGIAGAIFFDKEGKGFARVNGRSIEISKINFISDPALMQKANAKGQAAVATNPIQVPQKTDTEPTKLGEKVEEKFTNSDTIRKDWKHPGAKTTRNTNQYK